MNNLTRFAHPVMPAKKLKNKPLAIKIGNANIVLFRDNSGQAVALDDKCSHRFTPLSLGRVNKDGQIICPYHGWKFNSDGVGESPSIPNYKCKIKTYKTHEHLGYIWLANDDVEIEKNIPLNIVPENFDLLASYDIHFKTPLHVAFDNFQENEHFPFVHSLLGWNEKLAPQALVETKVLKDKVRVKYTGPQRPFWGMGAFMMKKGMWFQNSWETSFDPLRTCYEISYLKDSSGEILPPGLKSHFSIFMTPFGENETRFHVFQSAYLPFKFLKPLILPIYKSFGVWMMKRDLQLDVQFTEKISHISPSLKGAKLTKFDRAIVAGRKHIENIYFGNTTKMNSTQMPSELIESVNQTEENVFNC